MAHPVLLLTGMTPYSRIYARLFPAIPAASIVSWIKPLSRESIPSYAARLAITVDISTSPVVCGVSFGGIVARELAWQLKAKACVLISSIRSPNELPPWLRALRPFAGSRSESVLNLLGRFAGTVPYRVRSDSTARLTKLAGSGGAWHRWASSSVLRWNPSERVEQVPVVQIHGSRDATFPLRYVHPDLVIPGGGHEIALTHAAKVVSCIGQLAA